MNYLNYTKIELYELGVDDEISAMHPILMSVIEGDNTVYKGAIHTGDAGVLFFLGNRLYIDIRVFGGRSEPFVLEYQL